MCKRKIVSNNTFSILKYIRSEEAKIIGSSYKGKLKNRTIYINIISSLFDNDSILFELNYKHSAFGSFHGSVFSKEGLEKLILEIDNLKPKK